MTHLKQGVPILILALLAALAANGSADHGDAPRSAATPPLYENLGEFGRAVTTDSDLAQAYFDQGMRLAYSFARADAARSFQAAQRHDPQCAMCYWGEAWVLGPYQNNPGGVGEYDDALMASRRALDRATNVQPWERALIEAMVVRYPEAGNRVAATEAYADAMEAAATAHDRDLEVGTLFAESLMMYRPWDLYRADGEPYAETRKAVQVLEAVLEQDLAHPGACHLYIHAVEAWQPERAEACADLLASTVPGVAHMQHMPSHIYMNIGRYGDAVRGNQEALIVVQASEHDEGFVVYRGHNAGMLVFAAWMDGQSGVALSAARDLARANPGAVYQYELQLARFGRWDEILEQNTEPDDDFLTGMITFPRGLALLRTGNRQAASEALESIRAIRSQTPEDATHTFFEFSQRDLLGIAENILAGEIAAAEGRYTDAAASLREAIRLEDSLPYSEPEPWPIPARHVLGAVLLEANQPERAEMVYRESLDVHPANGWSLKGLEQSLVAQGRGAEASRVERAFEDAWQRADVWLPASRF
jgi:tetratricopeptide (TPR) repeat protein